MKKIAALFIIAACIFSGMLGYGAPSPKAAALSPFDPAQSAAALINQLDAGDYSGAEAKFDTAMQKALDTAALRSTWEVATSPLGARLSGTSAQTAVQDGYAVVTVTLPYEFYNLYVTVVYDSGNLVAGLHNAHAVNTALTPAVYQNGSLQEIHFDLVSGAYRLPAILTLPSHTSKVPAVLLIGGSGPNNRDEAVGAEQPFRDIARGLAQKGIASLRFDKRTFAYQTQMAAEAASVGINEEYTADVKAAFRYLSDYTGVDSKRVFLLGHSEGGMLAPRLALSTPSAAGLILLAGSPRRIEDIIVDQAALLAPSEVPELEKEAAEAKTLDRMAKAPDETVLGMPASYLKDWDSQDAAQDALKVGKPMLILQGERDAQVYMKDFNLWKQKLSSLPDVTYKAYPKLNHLFIEGTGKPNIAEYNTPGTVAPYVINDISSFVAPSAKPNAPKQANTASASGTAPSRTNYIPNPATGGRPDMTAIYAFGLLVAAGLAIVLKRHDFFRIFASFHKPLYSGRHRK